MARVGKGGMGFDPYEDMPREDLENYAREADTEIQLQRKAFEKLAAHSGGNVLENGRLRTILFWIRDRFERDGDTESVKWVDEMCEKKGVGDLDVPEENVTHVNLEVLAYGCPFHMSHKKGGLPSKWCFLAPRECGPSAP